MKTIAALTMLLVIASPVSSLASRDHRPVGKVLDTIPPQDPPMRSRVTDRRHPHRSSQRIMFSKKPHHRPVHNRLKYLWPVSTTTVVREIQSIIIVTPHPPARNRLLPLNPKKFGSRL